MKFGAFLYDSPLRYVVYGSPTRCARFGVARYLRFLGCVSWKNEYSGRHVHKTELATEETQTRPDARFSRTLREHFRQKRPDSPAPERPREVERLTKCQKSTGSHAPTSCAFPGRRTASTENTFLSR